MLDVSGSRGSPDFEIPIGDLVAIQADDGTRRRGRKLPSMRMFMAPEVEPAEAPVVPDPVRDAKDRQRVLRRARAYVEQIAQTLELYWPAAEQAIESGCFSSGEHVTLADERLLQRWCVGWGTCSEHVHPYVCASGHAAAVRSFCCRTAPCPREQRRRSAVWVKRAEALHGAGLTDGAWWRASELGSRGRKIEWEHGSVADGFRRPDGVGYQRCSWKMVTLGFRRGASRKADVDEIIRRRAAFAREFAPWIVAGFAAIEQGATSGRHIHLHAMIYGPFLPRDLVEKWWRALDCTVAGCAHPSNDRCEECKGACKEHRAVDGRPRRDLKCSACRALSRACEHPDGERQRCNGSWYVDVRKSRRGKHGFIEGLKYAAAPVEPSDAPHVGDDPTEEQQARAGDVLEFYVALHGRHRVETYGLAKPSAKIEIGEVLPGVSDAEPDGTTPSCPTCKRPMVALPCWFRVPGGAGRYVEMRAGPST